MFDPRTIPTNLTAAQAWVLFGLMGAAVVAVILDYISTVKGLAAGLKEGNPLMRWLFTKIGQPASAFVSVVVVLAVALPLSTWHAYPDMMFCGAVAGTEFLMFYRNSKLLKTSAKKS